MGRNIIIFSDGTGQAGGIHFDERRSNIYKMYRAMRCGPDSTIDPKTQLAFYDPGLGSALDGSTHSRGPMRAVYNLLSQATGFGITANIIDCYAALIRMWRPGDRIFLFGFSRGAYTVRCLAGVLRQCGIPTHMPDGSAVPLDSSSTRALATYAVKHVYKFTTSRKRDEATERQRFLLDTRAAIAARFRAEHGSEHPEVAGRPNVVPYFIGVFDTVASLMDRGKFAFIMVIALVLVALTGLLLSWPAGLSWLASTVLVGLGAAFLAVVAFATTLVKFDRHVPGYDWRQSLRTIHLTDFFLTFDDKSLDPYVEYAKHALSIDENRKPFARVKWRPSDEPVHGERDDDGRIRFEQIWFSGVHSDIGGSYAEDESRLSDIALKWMVDRATEIPGGLSYDASILRAYPDHEGLQHDARRDSTFRLLRRQVSFYPLKYRDPPKDAVLHPSVYDRFDSAGVPVYNRLEAYRPAALAEHMDVAHLYGEVKSPEPRKAMRTQIWLSDATPLAPTPRKIYPAIPKARKVRRPSPRAQRRGF